MAQLLKLVLRWSLIGAAATILGAVAVLLIARSSGFFSSLGGDIATEIAADQELVDERGTLKVPAERLPGNASEEMVAPSLALLPHRRVGGVTPIAVADDERQALSDAVMRTLTDWETYQPGDGADWRRRMDLHMSGNESGVSSRRDDLNAPAGAGTCDDCRLASRLSSVMDPRTYLQVVRLDDETAYVTTQAYVAYSGETTAGLVERRAYALLLSRDGPGAPWRTVRIVAETLPRVG